MLTTTARNAPRARALHTRRSIHSKPLSPVSAAQLGYAQQQSRGFRFGPWWTEACSDAPREHRRRHRVFRYRYMESVSRNLSWEKPGSSSGSVDSADPRAALKAALARAGKKSGNRPASDKDAARPSDSSLGFSPGRKNGDSVRDAVDHLFGADKTAPYEYDLWKSPLKNIRNRLQAERSPKEVTAAEVLHATTAADGDGSVIDPITNRRVSKKTSDEASFTPKFEDLDEGRSVKTRKTRQDADSGAVRWNEPDGLRKPTAEEESKKYQDLNKYRRTKLDDPDAPKKLTPEEESKKYDDLDKYEQTTLDDPDASRILTPEERSKFYDDLNKYGAVKWNEPDGLHKLSPEEKSKGYEDLGNYGPVRWSEPDGLPRVTPEEKSKKYEDLDKYGPVRWNEPNGLQELTLEEKSKVYDDLHSYGAVQWNEPDGLQKFTPEELSQNYDDLHQYGAVRWNEPGGLRKLTPEEESKKYDDLGTYGKPFTAKDSAIEAHEASQMDSTPRGLPLQSKVDVAFEDPAKEYDDLDKYGPVRWNEPDGLRKLTAEELSKNYNDLHKYGPVKWNEPDGLRVLTPEELSKLYEDLKAYSPPETTPDVPSLVHPEEASKNYQDLDKYEPKQFDEADGAYSMHPEELTKKYEDLNRYEPKQFDATDRTYPVHPEEATKTYKDLSSYEPKEFKSADQSYPVHPEEATKAYEDLDKYEPQSFDSTNLTYPPHPEEATKVYEDLGSYRGSFHNEPDGKPVEKKMFFSDFTETSMDMDSLTAQEIRAQVLRKARDNSQKYRLEQAKVESDQSWDATTKEAHQAVQQSKQSAGRKLTGNYVRDFPEEFTTSWSTAYSPSKSSLYPKDQAENPQAGNHEVETLGEVEAEVSSMDESFPKLATWIEPALDRGATRRSTQKELVHDFALDSQETSLYQSNHTAFGPVMVKHYGAKARKETETVATPVIPAQEMEAKPKDDEPASYKILAYDPTMQAINIAETTSVVPDNSTPLTPADVLLRLSNPAKFFPHFAPLQAEGYEILSGSGDVLIFRKVRAGGPARRLGPAPVNPIDMMGKPVTGNFASPTGFVNYNEVAEGASEKPEPPFRSNIDVRREEDVFSGSRMGSSGRKERKKRSLGRKMVMGTVWVAGTAYAVGVLGEYFSTGGFDGLGPKGL